MVGTKLLFTLIFIMLLTSILVRMAEWSKALVYIRHLWQAWVRITHLTIHSDEKIDATSFQ